MKRKQLLLFIGIVVIAAAAWFFVSPLFIDEAVDEDFPVVTSQPKPAPPKPTQTTPSYAGMSLPSKEQIANMTPEQREQAMTDMMDRMIEQPDRGTYDDMPEAGPTVLRSGQFVDADRIHKGSGTATLYQLADQSSLLRFEDFRVTNGPALVVYLSKHPNPTSAGDVKDAGFFDLGKLKGNVGNQNYPIPAEVKLDEYNSVVIWCELFGVLFSPAALN